MWRANCLTRKYTPCVCAVIAPAVQGWSLCVPTYRHEPRLSFVYMAAELRQADVGVPTTAAHWRESSPGKKQEKVETEAPGQRKWMGGIKENSDVFDWAGLHRSELISGLGLQLLPQVYGLLYARPSSTICVSWATEDCLQAPAANTQQPPQTRKHYSILL